MSIREVEALDISSTSSPALVTGSFNTTTEAAGAAQSYGYPRSLLVPIQCTRAAGSSMTAVLFKIQVSRTGADGSWVTILASRLGDAGGTVQQTHTLAVADNSTSFDGLATESARDWFFCRIAAKAVGADAVAGDSAAAWLVG